MPNKSELAGGEIGDLNKQKLLNALYISHHQFIRK